MLREVFYGESKTEFKMDLFQADAQPREIFIATCLLIPVMGIGLYPKIATATYDLKTTEIASKTRAALPIIVQQKVNNDYGFVSVLPQNQQVVLTAPVLP